ncbi:molybdopterin-dependent oxidoreductase [Mycobacterium sp. Marseille-P9652]|uniref:molybdopterin-dependent oxidoreductase n=1 Tax=Mycobacterium sp. Marseille-P9652 TaxID=2654950 RepID=UPI0012E72ECC|nr:molybdopterin-dependent oxidoreductase [Mycobacterium sp. Marseille-P9652]
MASDGPKTTERLESELPSDSGGYGFPARVWRRLDRLGTAARSLRRHWRSPLRGPWLTSVFGAVLLIGLPIVVVTGLLSYVAYAPKLGQALPADVGWLKLPTFDWPSRPVWLYRLTQGLHVGLGLVLIPVVIAKLWSVMPRLFAWPPARSIAQLVERVSVVMLVGGILFEIVTGLLFIQYDFLFWFPWHTAHYFGAWVFIAGFLMHVTLKLPKMVRGLRSMSMRKVLRTSRSDTRPEPRGPDGLVAEDPAPAAVSRRGALALVGAGALGVAILTAGQAIGGAGRETVLFLPHGRTRAGGPNDFPINKTAASAGIDAAAVDATWRLTLTGGPKPVVLDRAALAAMPQHTVRLPISCVQGWSTVQTWSGVRLADLATVAGVPAPLSARVQSLQQRTEDRIGDYSRAALQANEVRSPDALLALRVNGVDLSLDHGYPARTIVPALPGVHNTKWVSSIDFQAV